MHAHARLHAIALLRPSGFATLFSKKSTTLYGQTWSPDVHSAVTCIPPSCPAPVTQLLPYSAAGQPCCCHRRPILCTPHSELLDCGSAPGVCSEKDLGTRVTPQEPLSLALCLTCGYCCHRPCDAARAKYALKHTVRTHLGSDDQGYTAMGFGADAEGVQGMYMRKHVIEMAQRGLVENLRRLQPLMTPAAAKVRCAVRCQTHGTLLRGCVYANMAPTQKPEARSVVTS